MAVLLILLAFVLLTLWTRRALTGSWREAFVLALTVCGCWVWGTTELLSCFHGINFLGIAAMWGLLSVLAGIALWREKKPWPVIRTTGLSLSWIETMIVGFLAIIGIATAVNALNSPPNTWDALTYHMGRVAHWVQNGSVAYYPTHIPRQLFSNPWAEYVVLQFQVLSGGDHWASMVQWFCMAGSLVAVSLIAREFGLTRGAQWLAVLIAATVPIGIIESTSVQGDYAAALWLACSLVAFLNYQRTRSVLWALICGAGLGLACLSKGTAIIFMVPVIGWALWDAFLPYVGKKCVNLVLIVLIVVALNSLFVARNMEFVHQKMLGGLINSTVDYQTFTANLLRNVAIYAGTPSTKINTVIDRDTQALAHTLHVDLNDPRATFANYQFHVNKPSRDESTAAAPFHLIVYLLVAVILFIHRKGRSKVISYLCSMLAMVFLFLLVVRWQPWIIRFQLPLFILFAPLGAAVVDGCFNSKKNAALIIILFIIALPYVFDAAPRHLVGPKSLFKQKRMHRYFLENSGLDIPYTAAVNEVLKGGCKDVGLVLGEDTWEYPFYALLNRDRPWHGRMEDVKVDNFTKDIPYPLGSFDPCQVIVVGDDEGNTLRLNAKEYPLTNTFGQGREAVRIYAQG